MGGLEMDNQEDLLNRYTYNTDEIVGNYNVFYQTDPSELNTLDGSTLAFQKSYRGVKGLTQIAIPFAQAKNKLTRTDLENDLGLIQRTIQKVVNLFGNSNGASNQTLNSKLGALLVSKPVFNIDKIAFIREMYSFITICHDDKFWRGCAYLRGVVELKSFILINRW